ncbi:sugar kinase [Arenicella xantha]|uniref:2-dehydro-3-deoxygluconokinase n=1 Tax=Arenicella xantha TaxID=644221 RepID=A0A395JR19_9GAMM|nr:sugar kinase [Arenicella xantha]RBP53005.1 2-dehydro-3-deoxygluconokinase [Arenicella xantha]
MKERIAVLGECMLELRQAPVGQETALSEKTALSEQTALSQTISSRPMNMGFGGDTLNTAVYLARLGCEVSYFTALGDDPMSDWLISEWTSENVNCMNVMQFRNSVPGLYMISLADDGERSFYYWRKQSPASLMFEEPSRADAVFDALRDFQYLYLSGISLAILPDASQQRLLTFLAEYRDSGGRIVFDGNYRPSLWSHPGIARASYLKLYRLAYIVLPTFDDEQSLFDYTSPEQLVAAVHALGSTEIVVKMGGESCLYSSPEGTDYVPAKPVKPVDTTAAGDSFNAAYLAARLAGKSAKDACQHGHALASTVIQHRGAIIPRSGMPANQA